MYISSFKKIHLSLGFRFIFIFVIILALVCFASLRFIIIAAPYAENKARYLATDTINTVTGNYLRSKENILTDIISISHTETGMNYASVNSAKLNVVKAELTSLINNAITEDTQCTVNVPMSNYLGIPFLSGIGAPLKIKMHPVSRVLIDFEKDFYSAGINQTHFSLNLKVTVTILVTMPGMRRSVKVETDIPAGDAVFIGEVPYYFSSSGNIPVIIPDK